MTVHRYVPMHALEGKRAGMINLAAFGSLELVQGAVVFVLLVVAHRVGKGDGREEYKQELAANRSQRRKETAGGRRHALLDFPGDDEFFERTPADTGELRALTAAAEAGDLKAIRGLNAAFFRRLDLKRWARAS